MSERRPSAWRFGIAVLAVVGVLGLAAPWVAPYDPTEIIDSVAGRFQPPLTSMPAVHLADGGWRLADRIERTSEGLWMERLGERRLLAEEEVLNLTDDGVADRRFYLLGSDKFSRDVLSRALYGARVSLFVGIFSIALASTVGIAVGALAALGGRFLDGLLMRGVDGLLAFPQIFLVIALAAFFPATDWMLVLVIGGTAWMGISRLIRAELRSLKEREFVLAARGLGASPWRIFRRHLLPNALNPLLVAATLRVGNVILTEASLSFLGLGIQAPRASWGNMIADGRGSLLYAWWVAAIPALAIAATVIALNLAGDELRERLDPRR